MRTRHHFGLNIQVPIALGDDLFLPDSDAAPYLLSFSILLLALAGSEENLLTFSTPGTAEPFRIAPAEPVAYTNLVNCLRTIRLTTLKSISYDSLSTI
jgi:hypothetical protein